MTRQNATQSSERAAEASEPTAATDAEGSASGDRIGVGIDVVSVDRIAGAVERVGAPFLERAFTAAEAEYCRGRAEPPQHLAARWAAKEAAIKALPDCDAPTRMDEIEVVRDERGAPSLSFAGGAATAARALAGGDGRAPGRTVSLSHDRRAGVAAAVVVVTAADGPDARALRERVATAHADLGAEAGVRGDETPDAERLDAGCADREERSQ
jgi:holo-[acyl-carrier protein] synthase